MPFTMISFVSLLFLFDPLLNSYCAQYSDVLKCSCIWVFFFPFFYYLVISLFTFFISLYDHISLFCTHWQRSLFLNPEESILPSFLVTYTFNTASFYAKAFIIVINFLFLEAKFLSFSMVQIKKGSKYITNKTAWVIIYLIKVLHESLVSCSVFVFLRIFFRYFLLSLTFS